MGRQEAIARSIALAITKDHDRSSHRRGLLASILAWFSAALALYQLALRKIRPADFASLRRSAWAIKDHDYAHSFRPPGGPGSDRPKEEEALHAIGDMGFSGSTFYSTRDQKYLVKSVPRRSENSFFRDDLLTPYVEYMATHPTSLLVRIVDFLGALPLCLGRILGLAPSHHMIMENILFGQDQAAATDNKAPKWEHWDLKPTSYFYPERDLADGRLTSEATKAALADAFPDTIRLGRDAALDLFATLEADTRLLADHNAVDYSLFLVRMRAEGAPAGPLGLPTWKTGVASSDGKHVYRAAILDFFWAKHKMQPMLMTLLINVWRLLSRSGPMSITTTPVEYRERFLKMCREYVEIEADRQG